MRALSSTVQAVNIWVTGFILHVSLALHLALLEDPFQLIIGEKVVSRILHTDLSDWLNLNPVSGCESGRNT